MNWIFLIFFFLSFALQIDWELNIWPMPQNYENTPDGKNVEFNTLKFSMNGHEIHDSFIISAIQRYEKFFKINLESAEKIYKGTLHCDISISDLTVRELSEKNSEKYDISIKAPNDCKITTDTIFGFLRALETLTQMTSKGIIHNTPISITDFPRYSWRIFMIDVARHYLPISIIKTLIDAMSYNKLNVLHIHLVDAESFPLEIISYPLLNEKGSYKFNGHSFGKTVYTQRDIRDIINYAYLRGIRVIPEIDIFGHAYSWGHSYPQSIAQCTKYMYNINNIPLNPLTEITEKLTESVFSEVKELFDDMYVHTGGDEIVYNCWYEIKEIIQYLERHNISGHDLEGLKFKELILNVLKRKTNGEKEKISISWEERATKEVSKSEYELPRSEIVHVWKNLNNIENVISKGYTIINSAGWYINNIHCSSSYSQSQSKNEMVMDQWKWMYKIELTDYINSESKEDERYIKGGGAAMWGEQIEEYSVISLIFPKANAVSERLWSSKDINFHNNSTREMMTQKRLINHLCYSHRRRGIKVSPIRPDYCPFISFDNDHSYKTQSYLSEMIAFLISLCILFIFSFILMVFLIIMCTRYYNLKDEKDLNVSKAIKKIDNKKYIVINDND